MRSLMVPNLLDASSERCAINSAFEEDAKEKGLRLDTYRSGDHFYYLDPKTEQAWDCWLEAREERK